MFPLPTPQRTARSSWPRRISPWNGSPSPKMPPFGSRRSTVPGAHPVTGAVTLDASGWDSTAAIGETVILPAGQEAKLSGHPDSVVLRGWVPDLEREVISPARAAGPPIPRSAASGSLRQARSMAPGASHASRFSDQEPTPANLVASG